MKPSTALLLTTPALALATTTTPTVTLLLPYNGASSTYFGSVITAAPSSTEYAVTCAPLPASASATADGDGDFCGPEFTITQGPSIWAFAYTVAGEETLSARCEGDIGHTQALTCTQSIGGPSVSGSEAGVQTTMMQPSDYESVIGVVTVTAGGEKLAGGSVATTTTKSASGSLTTVTGTATGSATGAATATGGAAAVGVRQGAVVGVAGVVLAALAL
ncbi:uncharacterized protein BDZ99DRAFT_565491 [Mytilinidion resinicola]|uniref:GPI anchored protein n=1 Tax=Mytilinidion resinicola TaxID=574789 RepID=A0A6A6ZAV4_9PEZI|nr:uncharacterized protein BDZ99DRAFT_565491 [Mytilinidion resinicola]KAF2817829.1 hypothetical protein BDZ99DRAFT_565491 [Mytilinidion resinicola]